MQNIKSENILNAMELEISNEYFNCYRDEGNEFMICEAMTSYVPVDVFMETFQALTPIIKQHGIKKFIFDKRSLRAFHQPTMEWYFIVWKQELLQYGLKTHRKILPDGEWFRKCVEAGKASIIRENPGFNPDMYDIQYYSSIGECIDY